MRRLAISVVILAAVVAALGVLVGVGSPALLALDASVGKALAYQGPNAFYVGLLQVLTAAGLTVFRIVLLVPIAVFLAVRGRVRTMGFAVLAAGTVGPLTTLLKELVGRVRPSYDDPLVSASGLSYPSGHSAGAATLAGVLLVVFWPLVSRRWRPSLAVAAALGAICVAWTRLALGVHYLSDTVGGLALGTAVVFFWMAVFGLYRGGQAEPLERGRPTRDRGILARHD